MYSRGDARLEQTFMLEFHTSYFDYYSAPTSSSIIYYYAPAWATDEDIAAWKADDPYGIKKNTLVSKTIADGGIAPSNGAQPHTKTVVHKTTAMLVSRNLMIIQKLLLLTVILLAACMMW